METLPLPPKGCGGAPALESGFLKQGVTLSILYEIFLSVEEPSVFKIKPTLSKFLKVLCLTIVSLHLKIC